MNEQPCEDQGELPLRDVCSTEITSILAIRCRLQRYFLQLSKVQAALVKHLSQNRQIGFKLLMKYGYNKPLTY